MSVLKNALLLTALIAAVTLMFQIGIANADVSAAPAPEIVAAPACAAPAPAFAGDHWAAYWEAYACAHDLLVSDENPDYPTLLFLAQELNYHWIQLNAGEMDGLSHPFSAWNGDHRIKDYTLTFGAGSLWLETCNPDQPPSCVTTELTP